ncbi:MAG: hypothetical protein V7459_02470 [Oceanicoccus sp.]
MTEFEAQSLTNEVGANVIAMGDGFATHITIFMTLVSAYLVVAFLSGKRLTTLQMSIATALYSLAYFFESLLLAAYLRTGGRLIERLSEADPSASVGLIGDMGGYYLGAVIIIAVYISSLWFMWSVRTSSVTKDGNNS